MLASHPSRQSAQMLFPQACRPGELVTTTAAYYPTLCQILCVQDDGLVRVRGVGWPAGFSAWLAADLVRPAGVIFASQVPQRDD